MTGIAFITSTFGEASLKIGDVLVSRSADAAVVDANFLVARERAPKGKEPHRTRQFRIGARLCYSTVRVNFESAEPTSRRTKMILPKSF